LTKPRHLATMLVGAAGRHGKWARNAIPFEIK
jgi:hypothetical protein